MNFLLGVYWTLVKPHLGIQNWNLSLSVQSKICQEFFLNYCLDNPQHFLSFVYVVALWVVSVGTCFYQLRVGNQNHGRSHSFHLFYKTLWTPTDYFLLVLFDPKFVKQFLVYQFALCALRNYFFFRQLHCSFIITFLLTFIESIFILVSAAGFLRISRYIYINIYI